MTAQYSKKRPRKAARLLTIPAPPHLDWLAPQRIDPDTAARITHYSPRAVSRWHRSGITDPRALALLQAHAYGLLPHLDWREWFTGPDGTLNHRSGHRDLCGIRPGHLHALQQALTHARQLDTENRRLRALIANLSQPPARWPPDSAANDAEITPQIPLFAWQ